jgi:hypothetical protein
MIPKRKAEPGNRKARRAAGVKLIKVKRGGGGGGDAALAEALKAIVAQSDPVALMSAGILEGERGWLFHKDGHFAYAVTASKTHVTLHVVALHGERHASFKKRLPQGVFGKGLIRFPSDAKVDMTIIADLIRACADG